MDSKTLHKTLLLAYSAVIIWAVIHPKSFLALALEIVPALIGILILILTYHRFQFTDLTYVLLWIIAVLIAVGGHYTYEEMPLFDWIRDTMHLQRNHYDRFVHFAEGIASAMLIREILITQSPLKRGKWLFFIVIAISLSLSALYELSEFAVAKMAGKSSHAFLGMQGDIWDSQWDMLMGLTGTLLSLLALGKMHDRFLHREADHLEKTSFKIP